MEINDDSIGPQLEDYEYHAAIRIADSIRYAHSSDEILILTKAYEKFNTTVLQRMATTAALSQMIEYDDDEEELWD